MTVISYSDFRKNLMVYLDNACDNNEAVIVSRAHNKNVVVISLDEYNSWQETKCLLSTTKNHQRLEDAVKRGEHGIFETHNLIAE